MDKYTVLEVCNGFVVQCNRTGRTASIGDGVDQGLDVLPGQPGFCEAWTAAMNADPDAGTAYFPSKEFGDYAECVEYVNQTEYGYGQLEGEWYYADDESLTLYSGSFGNDNAPGADDWTNAHEFDTKADYDRDVAIWQMMPEYCDEV